MPDSIFFLHETDWEDNVLLPVENRIHCLAAMEQLRAYTSAQALGARTDKAFVLPDVQQDCRLIERQIRVEDLEERLRPSFAPATLVQTGSSTALRILCNAYAFGEGYGDRGAFYGLQEDGIVTALNLALPQSADPDVLEAYATILAELATIHDLFVLDWWRKRVVSVRDPAAALRYLREDVEDADSSG